MNRSGRRIADSDSPQAAGGSRILKRCPPVADQYKLTFVFVRIEIAQYCTEPVISVSCYRSCQWKGLCVCENMFYLIHNSPKTGLCADRLGSLQRLPTPPSWIRRTAMNERKRIRMGCRGSREGGEGMRRLNAECEILQVHSELVSFILYLSSP